MLKKVFPPVLAVLLIQFQIASVFSQDRTSQPPALQDIYRDYSFLDTLELSKQQLYPKELLEKERKELKKKEQIEKKEIRKEHLANKKELAKYQKQLSEISKKINKTEVKHEKIETKEEDGKKKTVTNLDTEALANDPEYQALLKEQKELRCKVTEWEIKADKEAFRDKLGGVDRFYEIANAQIDILEKWPAEEQKIQEEKKSGKSEERLFANPEDIGYRDLGFGDQSDDIKMGQEFIKFLKDNNKLEEYKNPFIKAYVTELIQDIVKNSDVKVPINENQIFLLDEKAPDGSRDINAWAVPGGFFGVTVGLLEEVENEAQLVGVLAHELGHVAARHGYRRMKKANFLGYLLLPTIFLPGGYWIYQGLGFGFSLIILGITREYELEADTLGMQYTWKSDYDPMSFISFFEKLGRDKGSIRGSSFFRTHPVSLVRIVNTFRELSFLPSKEDYMITSNYFLEMKAQLCVDAETEFKLKERPSSARPTLRGKEVKEKESKEKERGRCGVQKPAEVKKKSFCDDPALEQYKEEIRKQRKETPQEVPEKTRPTLKRK